MTRKTVEEWSATIVSIMINLYMVIAWILGLLMLVTDTVQVYQEAGPVDGMFWFFTIGPIVATVKGVFWPLVICGGGCT